MGCIAIHNQETAMITSFNMVTSHQWYSVAVIRPLVDVWTLTLDGMLIPFSENPIALLEDDDSGKFL